MDNVPLRVFIPGRASVVRQTQKRVCVRVCLSVVGKRTSCVRREGVGVVTLVRQLSEERSAVFPEPRQSSPSWQTVGMRTKTASETVAPGDLNAADSVKRAYSKFT